MEPEPEPNEFAGFTHFCESVIALRATKTVHEIVALTGATRNMINLILRAHLRKNGGVKRGRPNFSGVSRESREKLAAQRAQRKQEATERRARFAQLHETMTVREIAEHTGHDVGKVRNDLIYLGCFKKSGRHAETLLGNRKRDGSKLTVEQFDQLCEDIKTEKWPNMTEASKHYGITRERVRQIARHIGSTAYILKLPPEVKAERRARQQAATEAKRARHLRILELWNNPEISTSAVAQELGWSYWRVINYVGRHRRRGGQPPVINRRCISKPWRKEKMLTSAYWVEKRRQTEARMLQAAEAHKLGYVEGAKAMGISVDRLRSLAYQGRKVRPDLFPFIEGWRVGRNQHPKYDPQVRTAQLAAAWKLGLAEGARSLGITVSTFQSYVSKQRCQHGTQLFPRLIRSQPPRKHAFLHSGPHMERLSKAFNEHGFRGGAEAMGLTIKTFYSYVSKMRKVRPDLFPYLR